MLRSHRRPGFTLIELVVVITIMTILAAMLVSGYASMQKTQRLNNAADKVLSMLYKARSLAISNNAIYLVRLQDGYWSDPLTINPVTGRPKDDGQWIMLYRYTSTSEALSIHTTLDMGPGRNAACSLSIPPEERYQQMMDEATKMAATDPTAADLHRTKAEQLCKNPNRPDANGDPMFYNNYRPDQVKLDQGTYLGIQAPLPPAPSPSGPLNDVIFFYPDGTASKSITIFVTDLSYDTYASRTPQNDFRDDRSPTVAAEVYAERNQERTEAHADARHARNLNIRMVQVLRGGMIKMLKQQEAPQ